MAARARWTLVALLMIASPVFAKTICVNASASGANDGTCWAGAYTSLQTALGAAVSGDEIWVAAATYKPTATTTRTISFALKDGVGVYGGFVGTETMRSQRDPVAHVTTLSGEIGAAGVSDNSYHVVLADATVTNAGVLDGFTITAGNASGTAPDDRGGGMWVNGGKPTVAHCVFLGNSASEKGGGLRVTNGMPVVDSCLFNGNSASVGGGGIGTGSGSVFTVKNSVFRNNGTVSTGGAGIEAFDGVTVVNCAFQGNGANGLRFMSSGTVSDSTFTGNASYAVAFDQDGTVVNSILWNDAIDEVFAGFGTISVSYSDVGGSGFAGTGNKNANPLFVNAGANDLRLGAGSPAVDAGKNLSVPGGITTDANGLPRFFDDPAVADTGSGTPPIVDMGAYERVPLSVTAASPATLTVCAGAPAAFSVTATGQTPTFRWRRNTVPLSNGGSITGALTADLSINPTVTGDAGSYDVVVTDAYGQTVTSVAATLTVNAVPAAPTAGNDGPVCAGSTLHLTASTVPGATYSWTGPNGFTSTLQNPTIASATTAATGVYTVHAIANGCSSAGATTSATVTAVPAPPTAGNGGAICAGQTLTLTASAVAGATYSWTGPNSFASALQNPTIPSATAAASGTYSVTVTVNGCTSTATTTNAVVRALPSATVTAPPAVCASSTGNAASVPDAGLGATYAWTIGGGTITGGAGTRSITFSAAASGSVSLSVTVTDANGCSASGGATVPISAACLSFYSVTPCRIADTRNPAGPSGGPIIAPNSSRAFPVTGVCGVPPTAKAVSLIVVAVAPGDTGDFRLFPTGQALPLTSALNFDAGRTRANNAVISLGTGGQITLRCDMPVGSVGTVHFVADVFGYFQ